MVQTLPLRTTCLHSAADLTPYLEAWRELAGAPMRSPEWLLAWWETYAAPGDQLYLVLMHNDDGLLVGLTPLYLQGAGGGGTFRILGMENACTHHADWICAAGWEARVGEAVGIFLLRCKAVWKRLLFEAVDADADAIPSTIGFLADNGCLCHRRPVNSVWRIALPPSWDDYLQTLSRSLRKRCRKLQRQFLDSAKIQIRQVTNGADLDHGFTILLNLHGARWGNAKKPLGVFADPRFRAFHQKVSRSLLDRQQLRLAWLECDGKPIAVEYQFVDAKAVYAYQAGVDLSMDDYAPGKLSMMAAIQFAIARGCKTFDLLGGDEPYKGHWRAVPVACHDLRVWQNGLLAHAAWALWSSYTLAAGRLKPILPRRVIHLGLKSLQAARDACRALVRDGR